MSEAKQETLTDELTNLVTLIFCSRTKYCTIVGVDFLAEDGGRLEIRYKSAAKPDVICAIGIKTKPESIATAANEAAEAAMGVIETKLDGPFIKDRFDKVIAARKKLSPAALAMWNTLPQRF